MSNTSAPVAILHLAPKMPDVSCQMAPVATIPASAVGSDSTTTDSRVTVKSMLEVESKYCTKIRHLESMKYPVSEDQPINREDIPVPDARVFILHNLLSEAECDHYIKETEEISYRDIKSEFDDEYRSNERILVLSNVLAELLWRRMQPHLHRGDVMRIRPMCFGNGGSWLPHRLNECFKFGKYQKKQHFGTHIDGPWVPRTDESSIYTVLIYLNRNFSGGRTVFLPESAKSEVDANIAAQRHCRDERTRQAQEEAVFAESFTPNGYYRSESGHITVAPRTGSALIFTHDTLHAGLPVIDGTKYVLRTEIMFTRTDTASIPPSIRDSFQTDPDYLKALTLYRESEEKSRKGDVTGFTNSYLAALKLQHEAQFSVSKDTKAILELNLPLSLYVHIFTFLGVKDLVSALQCSKSFRDIGKDGTLWKLQYKLRFPQHALMEQSLMQQHKLVTASTAASSSSTLAASIPPVSIGFPAINFGAVDPAIQDWHTVFKQRVQMEKDFSAIIFDFGSFATRCSLVSPSSTPIYEMESIVSLVPGIFDLHMRRGQFERFFCGAAAREHEEYGQFVRGVLAHGQIQHRGLLIELCAALYLKLSIWSSTAPVIVAEPPFGWSPQIKSSLSASFFNIFRVPALCFVNSALLSLLSLGHDSGFVVNVGAETCWIACFYQQRMIGFVNLTDQMPSVETSQRLKEFCILEKDGKTMNMNPYDLVDEPVRRAARKVSEPVPPRMSPMNPILLAEQTAELYLKVLSEHPKQPDFSSAVQDVILVGGGSLDPEFKFQQEFVRGIDEANSQRFHCETHGDLSIKSAVNLNVILPKNRTQTVVEGGRIFGGLSIFKAQCRESFDGHTKPRRRTDDDYRSDSPTSELEKEAVRFQGFHFYQWVWSINYWLDSQLMYHMIRDNFHLEGDEFIENDDNAEQQLRSKRRQWNRAHQEAYQDEGEAACEDAKQVAKRHEDIELSFQDYLKLTQPDPSNLMPLPIPPEERKKRTALNQQPTQWFLQTHQDHQPPSTTTTPSNDAIKALMASNDDHSLITDITTTLTSADLNMAEALGYWDGHSYLMAKFGPDYRQSCDQAIGLSKGVAYEAEGSEPDCATPTEEYEEREQMAAMTEEVYEATTATPFTFANPQLEQFLPHDFKRFRYLGDAFPETNPAEPEFENEDVPDLAAEDEVQDEEA